MGRPTPLTFRLVTYVDLDFKEVRSSYSYLKYKDPNILLLTLPDTRSFLTPELKLQAHRIAIWGLIEYTVKIYIVT